MRNQHCKFLRPVSRKLCLCIKGS